MRRENRDVLLAAWWLFASSAAVGAIVLVGARTSDTAELALCGVAAFAGGVAIQGSWEAFQRAWMKRGERTNWS